MAETALVKELLDLPEEIHKGDFVLKLSEGIRDPATTAQTYVVTPMLADAFDRALRLVGAALRDKKSQAAYLHGSFGSGKSHFMAMLSLLLAGNEDVWRIPELHPLRERHGFAGTANLLELHFHMVGHESLEEALYTEYLGFLRQHHPDAAVPSLFGDEALFAMAAELLEEMGEDTFFAPMNQGASADSRWGKKAAVWTRASFDAAVASDDPAVRAELFSALVKKRFKGWERESRAFVDLDAGLATIARHAAGLGYHGIILFLDELILWLAGRAADAAWLHQEAQKLVKLIEAADMQRDIPIVSLIARQRDLAEMVGEQYAGAENARLRDSLNWMSERFEKIPLDDKNLPAIVEKRVLSAKDESARQAMDGAFDALKRGAGASWSALLGSDDAGAFRKLYPFSPALVEVLVALSNSLQRQRTAIKLLNEILVEHIDDLELGQIVCVGDLFDLLAAGEESADGMMRARFDSAKQIYKHQLLPLIREQNGTASPERCQRLRDEHPARLGCSNCPEKACRTDNRLVKTLLVAALVPNTEVVKDLTASRLVQLNHGSVRVPIAGTEASIVAQKLRTWASAVGQLQVGAEADPSVSLRLEGVDVGPILDKARHADSAGARMRVLRDLLFECLGIEKVVDKGNQHKVDWRGSRRSGYVHFGNVRTMPAEMLRCNDDHDWRLVVDYPFDDAEHGPQDDVEVIEQFTDEGAGSWTLAWLPSFLSDRMEKMLGELVLLDEILGAGKKREYVQDLSVENQSRALIDLENLQSMKKARLIQVLGECYGVARPQEGDLDSARSLDKHLFLLKPGAKLAAPVPAGLADAVDTYVKALLAARWPRHPELTESLTRARVERLVERFGELVDSDDKRIPADKALVEEMRGTLGVLGLVRVTENAVLLVEDRTLQDLEQRRLQKAIDAPTVAQLRTWLDDNDKMGLQRPAEDLVVRCYARWASRTFTHFGKPVTVQAGTALLDDAVLEKPDLPGQVAWSGALAKAAATLGLTFANKALHADNLKRFEADLTARLADVGKPAAALPAALSKWAELLGVAMDADRLVTARSGDALCAALIGHGAVAQVEVLHAFAARTSDRALGTSLHNAGALVPRLHDNLTFGVFAQLMARRSELAGAAELLEQAAAAVRQDEIHIALGARLRQLAEEGQRLLSGGVEAAAPPAGSRTFTVRAVGRAEAAAELDDVVARVRAAIDEAGDEVELGGTLVVKTRS